jgi:hypothetical protein
LRETSRKIGGRIILKLILEKSDWLIWTGSFWPRIGTNEGLLVTW